MCRSEWHATVAREIIVSGKKGDESPQYDLLLPSGKGLSMGAVVHILRRRKILSGIIQVPLMSAVDGADQ